MSRTSPDFDEVGRFRPNLKPLALALVANLLFAGGLLGYPYLRGQERAEASASAFATFAGCLFAAEPSAAPGLTLPRGERSRYATLVLTGAVSTGAASTGATSEPWPARCRGALRDIAHPPAIMLFPAAKSGEQAVAEAVERLDDALAQLAADDEGVVPEAPLAELSRLQAALSAHLAAAGIALDPMAEAVSLGDARDLPTPSIVPLRIGEGPLEVALDGAALLASGEDARRVGHVRVGPDGEIEVRLARRRALVSSMIGAREPPWVLWTTPADQCREDPRSCAQRATGIAPFADDQQRLTPWAWLRAHPHTSSRDAVHVSSDAVFVAARGEGGLDVRRFSLPAEHQDPPAELAAELELGLDVDPARVRWIDGSPPALVWAGADGAGLVVAGERSTPLRWDAPGADATVVSCGRAEDGWVGLANERAIHLRRTDGDGASVVLEPGIGSPDAIALVCRGESVDVVLTRARTLLRAACDPSGCDPPQVLAEGVFGFDAARLRDALLVAFSSRPTDGPVRIARVRGESLDVLTPAACWTTAHGLCGPPKLATDEARAVLVTRQGGDLRVLTSDDGVRWDALPGLAQP